MQVNAARDWAKAVKDAAAYLKQNLNAAEAALLDGVAAIVAEKDEVFKTIDGNTHVDVAKIRQDAVVQKWAATLATHQAASESTFANVELQRPALVQTALNADANSSRATGFFAGIEQGLNALTGGESRQILLSPEFTAALNAVDGFFAGVADSLTAGLSTRLRSAMWGQAATQNHSGPWFTAGQIAGTILSIPVMAANPCSLGAVFGVGLRVLNGIQLVGNGISAVENIAAGNYLSAGMNVLGMVANLNQLRRACFTGEMQVKTKRGWVRWDALLPTDAVLSCDEHDPHGELAYKPIETLLQTEAEIWHVHVNGQVIRTTSEHPFYVWDKGWTAAKNLQLGDLLRSDDGQVVAVEDVFNTGVVEPVYNCSVAEYHTYFVGNRTWNFSVWAHNRCWNAARRAFWKDLAKKELTKPANLRKYSTKNLARMSEGRAPKIRVSIQNRKTGEVVTRNVSLELHHRAIPQRAGSNVGNASWNLEIVNPWAHEAMDSFRHVGWNLRKILNGANSF